MKIDYESLIEWAEKRLGDTVISGSEIKVNDPWWENGARLPDSEHKCWINVDKGCYHAFKSGKTGTVIDLVMEIEQCDWERALEIVGGEDSIEALEKKLDDFLQQEAEQHKPQFKKTVVLPPKTVAINSHPDKLICNLAAKYLKKRNLPTDNLMVCLEGDYRNRIVIPYYDKEGKLIYWNTRAIFNDGSLRYWGPDKTEFNVGKSDVLWLSSWPKAGTKIYLTEGEFDAMSLVACGFHAGACGGKSLGDKQIELLTPYRITLALDADKAGNDIYEIAQRLISKGGLFMNGAPRINMVRPPMELKDWNKFYVDLGSEFVQTWIARYERVCDDDTLTKMRFRVLNDNRRIVEKT